MHSACDRRYVIFNHWPCLRPHAELVILVPFSVPSVTRQLMAYVVYPPGRLVAVACMAYPPGRLVAVAYMVVASSVFRSTILTTFTCSTRFSADHCFLAIAARPSQVLETGYSQ